MYWYTHDVNILLFSTNAKSLYDKVCFADFILFFTSTPSCLNCSLLTIKSFLNEAIKNHSSSHVLNPKTALLCVSRSKKTVKCYAFQYFLACVCYYKQSDNLLCITSKKTKQKQTNAQFQTAFASV